MFRVLASSLVGVCGILGKWRQVSLCVPLCLAVLSPGSPHALQLKRSRKGVQPVDVNTESLLV